VKGAPIVRYIAFNLMSAAIQSGEPISSVMQSCNTIGGAVNYSVPTDTLPSIIAKGVCGGYQTTGILTANRSIN
jgi:hypothetical protein